MLFHSWQFFVFFFLIFVLYWQLDTKRQNRWLLIASYVFYGWWDWRFLGLVFISTIVDYVAGRNIFTAKQANQKHTWLLVSIITNLGILGFFKYYNFFAASLVGLFQQFGFDLEPRLLSIILPVGISFYTFQTMSYTIDIYRNKLKPTNNLADFALFVAFFPQLIAGPIERATHLLPQIQQPRKLDRRKINSGLWLFFWGLWLKVFVADGLSPLTEQIFNPATVSDGMTTVIGAWAFSWQIFADFAGYSSMARGLAKLLGFDLMVNFDLPFWAQNVSDFWRRWHISLSNWVKDYIYIPLGGNRVGKTRAAINIILTMTIMGLWHGANTNFIIWGLYCGLCLAGYQLYHTSRLKYVGQSLAKYNTHLTWYINAFITFNIFAFGMIIFRAQSMSHLNQLLSSLTSFGLPLSIQHWDMLIILISHIVLLVLISIYTHKQKQNLAILKLSNLIKAPIVAIMLYGLLFYGQAGEAFLYFAF